MSDSQTATIPAAHHAATAETRPARLLRALAQNPEPLSSPALAGLLAEPGRRRRLLSSSDHTLRRHEHAGHVEQAGRERKGRGRPAIIWRITRACLRSQGPEPFADGGDVECCLVADDGSRSGWRRHGCA
jgi:hypothetical protein